MCPNISKQNKKLGNMGQMCETLTPKKPTGKFKIWSNRQKWLEISTEHKKIALFWLWSLTNWKAVFVHWLESLTNWQSFALAGNKQSTQVSKMNGQSPEKVHAERPPQDSIWN